MSEIVSISPLNDQDRWEAACAIAVRWGGGLTFVEALKAVRTVERVLEKGKTDWPGSRADWRASLADLAYRDLKTQVQS